MESFGKFTSYYDKLSVILTKIMQENNYEYSGHVSITNPVIGNQSSD